MKNKIFSVLVVLTFVLNLGGMVAAQKVGGETSGYQLAKLLPESDAIVLLDSNKLIKETLPQVLSANQPMLTKIIGKIDNLKLETGLDLRDFKDVVIGLKNKIGSNSEIDFDPVVLGRGAIDSKAIISIARLASDGKYHTEKFGKHTIYIFSSEKLINDNKPNSKTKDDKSFLDKTVDKIFKGVSKELAITAYNDNTVALGSLARVKEMVGKSARISGKVLGLVQGNPNAVAKFGAALPNGLSTYIALDNDELSQTLNSVRKLQGSFDVNDGNAFLSVSAETLEVKDAEELEGTLIGFQMLGKMLLGKSKGADKQAYSRMIENARISRKEKLIMFELKVPKSDIDVIVGKK